MHSWLIFDQHGGIDAALELLTGSLQATVIQRALEKFYHLDALVLSQLLMETKRRTMKYDHTILAKIRRFYFGTLVRSRAVVP